MVSLEKHPFYNSIESKETKLLVKLHIQDYLHAYKLDAAQMERDTLARQGKGNEKRKRLIEKNTKKLSGQTGLASQEKNKLEAVNTILEMIVHPDQKKVGLLLIGTYCVLKSDLRKIIHREFAFRLAAKVFFTELMNTMEFYGSTHVSKNKIVNSLVIVLFGLLVKQLKHDRLESTKFIEDVVNVYFDPLDVPKKIRADYIEKYPVYIAGTSAGLPIFQHDTSKEGNYYTQEDLKIIQGFLASMLNNQKVLNELEQLDNQKGMAAMALMGVDSEILEKFIQKLPLIYAKNPTSLAKYHQNQAKKQRWKNFLKFPLLSIKTVLSTILTNLYTKLTR
jgi:hypothetical protein